MFGQEFETGGEILEALRKAEAREEEKQNQCSETSIKASPVKLSPNGPTSGRTPANKRKLSAGDAASVAVSSTSSVPDSVPLHKRLKVSEEECGELSISIPEMTPDMSATVKLSSGNIVLSPPAVLGVGAALPPTPLTGCGNRGRNRTESACLDVAQV